MNILRNGKRQFRIHHRLSNNQIISMFISIDKYDYKPTHFLVARIGLAISNNKRTNNDWYESKNNKRAQKLKLRTTGRVGLEGLIWAKKTLAEVESYLLSIYSVPLWTKITWVDDQRLKVYSRLERDNYFFLYWNGENCLMKTLRDYNKGE